MHGVKVALIEFRYIINDVRSHAFSWKSHYFKKWWKKWLWDFHYYFSETKYEKSEISVKLLEQGFAIFLGGRTLLRGKNFYSSIFVSMGLDFCFFDETIISTRNLDYLASKILIFLEHFRKLFLIFFSNLYSNWCRVKKLKERCFHIPRNFWIWASCSLAPSNFLKISNDGPGRLFLNSLKKIKKKCLNYGDLNFKSGS